MKSSISVIGLLLGSSVEGLSLQKKAILMTPRSNAEEAHEKYIEEQALNATPIFDRIDQANSLSSVDNFVPPELKNTQAEKYILSSHEVPPELKGTEAEKFGPQSLHASKSAAKSDDDHDEGEDHHEENNGVDPKAAKKKKAQEEAKARAAAINFKDPKSPAVIEFFKEYDHVGYDRNQIALDKDRIKIEKTHKDDSAPFCAMDDWTTVHYKAFNGDQLIEDSRTFEQGKPKIFRLGHYEVSKCWDISLQQIRQGESASVSCPGELAQGGQIDQHTQDAQGSNWTPTYADLRYEFDVIECGVNPPSLQPAMYREELLPGQCFYIVSSGPLGIGSKLALEAAPRDKYYPKYYGLYNIGVAEYGGREANKKAQQWMYDGEEHVVKSLLHPEAVLFEGFNTNLVVYKNLKMPNQRFAYDDVKQQWSNTFTGRAIHLDDFVAGSNVHTKEPTNPTKADEKWTLEYCEEDHGHDH